ncbi:MAG: hypothetical protein KME06_14595 [Kastovskya adunca ATA6-11-RM4]|nr:hypothetical protein [Kastovskya adunca ATA6-11-RM4]
MKHSDSIDLPLEQLTYDTTDELPGSLETILRRSEEYSQSSGEQLKASGLSLNNISRNKRALIERIIAIRYVRR